MAQTTDTAARGLMTEEEHEIERDKIFWHSQFQGIYGAVATASSLVLAHVGLQKFVPLYAAINWRYKAFTLSHLTVGAYAIHAENSHLEKMANVADDNALRRQAADEAFVKARQAARNK